MTTMNIYEPKYGLSHALVIGINEYEHVPRLGHAQNDAEAFARVLRERFEFTKDNLTILTDGDATQSEILRAFMEYAQDSNVGDDDRIVCILRRPRTHCSISSGRDRVSRTR